MHIFSNIKNFLYDNNDFIAYYNNSIYLYNFNKIDTLNNNEIIVLYDHKKISIKGINLKVSKCLNKELVVNGSLESINIYE